MSLSLSSSVCVSACFSGCVCMFVYLCMSLSLLCFSVCLCLSLCLSISLCLSLLCFFVCLCMSLCLCVCVSHLFLCVSICLCACLCFSVSLSFYAHACLQMYDPAQARRIYPALLYPSPFSSWEAGSSTSPGSLPEPGDGLVACNPQCSCLHAPQLWGYRHMCCRHFLHGH